jgi:hypothetical protein
VGILGLSSRGTLDIEEVNIRGKGIIESDRVTKDRKRVFSQHLQLPGLSILYSAQFPIHIMNIYVLRAGKPECPQLLGWIMLGSRGE